MDKRRNIRTSYKDIVDYWINRADVYGVYLDWDEAGERCWRCGCERSLQRCHIIPDSLGGEDKPENLVLLCKRCHEEGPNIADPEIMWDWIRAYRAQAGELFWQIQGVEEYKRVYGTDYKDDLAAAMGKDKLSEEKFQQLKEVMFQIVQKVTVHYGQSYPNPATWAGVYRLLIQQLRNRVD